MRAAHGSRGATTSRPHPAPSTGGSGGDDHASDVVVEDDEEEASYFIPQPPFNLTGEMLEKIKLHVIGEEGVDPQNEEALHLAVMQMAEELCEASIADDDAGLDQEILEAAAVAAVPYAAAQDAWLDSRSDEWGSAATHSYGVKGTGFDTGGGATLRRPC
jgi:hypothetical protein